MKTQPGNNRLKKALLVAAIATFSGLPVLVFAQPHSVSDMKMQGGPAPADARDPDAYSGDYVRNAGKYALPPSDALVMSDMHNFGSVQFDRFEYVRARGRLEDSRTELLWRHAVSTFWDTELGNRSLLVRSGCDGLCRSKWTNRIAVKVRIRYFADTKAVPSTRCRGEFLRERRQSARDRKWLERRHSRFAP